MNWPRGSGEGCARCWSGESIWLMVAPIVGRLTLAVALAVLAMYCFLNLA